MDTVDYYLNLLSDQAWNILPEGVLYGIFGLMLVLDTCIITARNNENATRTNRALLVVAALMFVVATLHIVTSVCTLYFSNITYAWYVKAYGTAGSATQLPTNSEYNSKIMEILQMALFVVQMWLGDGFMLFRLWKVWDKKKCVVLPISVGFLANIALGILLVYTAVAEDLGLVGKGSGVQSSIAEILSVPTIISVYSLSFAVHLSCTVMIAGRILYLNRRVSSWVHGQVRSSSMAIAVILLESGALYSASMLCVLITTHYTLTGHYDSAHIVMNSIVPLIGITFSIIIIRMGLGISTEAHLRAQANGEVTSSRTLATSETVTHSVMLFSSRRRSSEELEPKTTV